MTTPPEDPPSREEVRARLRKIRARIRITKISSTRAIKGRNGDSFVGFSASFLSVQNDFGGMGADAHGTTEEDAVVSEQGLSLADARIARLLLSMECDLAALESAAANGGISQEMCEANMRGVKSNYQQLIFREMGVTSDGLGTNDK